MATSRAEDQGVSTKRLRRFSVVRLERIRRASMALRSEWGKLDDLTTDTALDEFGRAIDTLESELAQIIEYHDLPVGQEVGD